MRSKVFILWAVLCGSSSLVTAADEWRTLPLINNGKIADGWKHIGWGGFAIDHGSLRTDCDAKGMGLLLYTKEKFGDCQLRIVFRAKDAKSNAGVFVRIDDGILDRLDQNAPPVARTGDGALVEGALDKLQESSEKELGAWYPVHHGYEVQICDEGNEYHRTGSIYSLAKAAAAPETKPDDWKTMLITLKGNLVLVEIDGQQTTSFDPESKDIPQERKWFEPKREPKRPTTGYVGLQNHDPGDVVYFKEVSVRRLDKP